MGKFTPLTERLFDYICDTASGAADPVLRALRKETEALGKIAVMQIGADQGALMTLLTRALGVRSAIEVGTFTGYSSICIARGLPKNGKLLCLDASDEWTAVAKKYWGKAKVADRIELRIGPALETLRNLEAKRTFDMAFIDAQKTEYEAYYELVLPRVRPNGVILFDNMLRSGNVGKASVKEAGTVAIDRLNRKLARDARVETVLLSVGDGLRLCRVRER